MQLRAPGDGRLRLRVERRWPALLAAVLQRADLVELEARLGVGPGDARGLLQVVDQQDLRLHFGLGAGLGALLVALLAADPCEGLAQVGFDARRVAERTVEDGLHTA